MPEAAESSDGHEDWLPAPWTLLESLQTGVESARWSPSRSMLEMDILAQATRHYDARHSDVQRVSISATGIPWDPDSPTAPGVFQVQLAESVRHVDLSLGEGRQVGIQFLGGHLNSLTVSGGGRRMSRAEVHLQTVANVTASSVELIALLPAYPGAEGIGAVTSDAASVVLPHRDVARAVVRGDCALSGGGRVAELVVGPGGRLRAELAQPVGRLTRDGGGGRAAGAGLVLVDGSRLAVDDMSDVGVEVAGSALLLLPRGCERLDLGGTGTVVVQTVAREVRLSGALRLDVEPHAQLLDVCGTARLGRITNATIIASAAMPLAGRPEPSDRPREGLEISDVLGSKDHEDAVKGSSLSGVTFPVDSHGLQVMSVLMEDAHHVSPLVHPGLPGLARGSLRFRRRRLEPASADTAAVRAIYARTLAELAASKGAPASTRSMLAWCSYRMRNLTAPRWEERRILSAYRLIGYGERFIPPFVTYMVIALLMCLVGMLDRPVDLSIEGAANVLWAWMDWLATPLHVLRLTGPDPKLAVFAQPWDTLARILVAIPFGTAVLALRKYVKEKHDRS